MKVQIEDVDALRKVSRTALRAYLQSNGWIHTETWRNRILIWSKECDGRNRDILMPLHEDSSSYATRIYEAVSLLAKLENRSQLDVYYDLMEAGADVIRLRLLNGK